MSQPFYHLRPNKHIDRCLFINCIDGLRAELNLQAYRYIGFGSYTFDDFKQVHDQLGINSMISLEKDPTIFKRAQYNVPYKCIEVIQQSSGDYISGGEWGENNTIIWLDYTSPKDINEQFEEIAALSNIVKEKDVIRVTFNANPEALVKYGKKEKLLEQRLDKLKDRIEKYVPTEIKPSDMTEARYPIAILRCLKKLLEGSFVETEYDKRYIFPLFSTVYKDGQQMVTFTGIVLEDHEQEKRYRDRLSAFDYVNFKWDMPSVIKVPLLTVKEMLEINKLLPDVDVLEQLKDEYGFVFCDEDESDDIIERVKSYMSYYRHYPSYHNVSL